MALDRQNVPISFVQGLDLKDDVKQILPGRLLTLENAVFQTPGKLRKRNGYMALSTSISGGGAITAGAGIGTFRNELLEFDGLKIYSYSPQLTNWTNRGTFVGCRLTLDNIYRASGTIGYTDHAIAPNNTECIVWTQFSDGDTILTHPELRYSIKDLVTGDMLVSSGLINGLNGLLGMPKVVVLGTNFIIVYARGQVDNTLYAAVIPYASPTTAPTAVALATDFDSGFPVFDICVFSSVMYYTYPKNGGTDTSQVNTLATNLTVGTTFTATGVILTDAAAIFADSGLSQIWVAAVSSGGGTTFFKYYILNQAATAYVLSPVTVNSPAGNMRYYNVIGTASGGSGSFWLSFNTQDTTLLEPSMRVNVQYWSANNVGTVSINLPNQAGYCTIVGKIFLYNTVAYYLAASITVQQATIFLINGYTGAVIARGLFGIFTQDIAIQGQRITPSEAVVVSSGVVQYGTMETSLLVTQTSLTQTTQTGAVIVKFDFTSLNAYQSQEIANNLYITSGMLRMYDGVNSVEQGFNLFPEGVTTSPSNVGGNLGSSTVATTYQYSVTYEWTDAQGQIHRSFPSIPSANTTVSFASGVTTGKVILTIPILSITDKINVVINVYRTTGNGTIFYLLNNPAAPLFNPNTHSPGGTITYTDTAADTSITGNSLLYTTGNVAPNDPGPAADALAIYQNRLMLVPSENPGQLWFSEQVVPGTPVNFSLEFVLNVDQRGGAVTNIFPMDDKLIIFKKEAVFYMTGSGPDSTGGQNDFSSTILVVTDVGQIDVRSAVIMPLGIMFKSTKGVYLIDRSMNVSYIGSSVEFYNNQTVQSALLMENVNQVRFPLMSGPVLIYDYYVKQWSTFTFVNALQAVNFSGNFTYVTSNGTVFEETPGVFTDNGAAISMKLVTGWLSIAGLQGFKRLRRMLVLGEWVSSHNLTVKVAYDFNSTFTQTDVIPSTTSLVPYQWRVDFERQKCQAIQFLIQDAPNSPFGEGLSLSNFNLMAGVKKGSNKVVPNVIYS